MTVFMDESNEKGPKRLIDVKVVNKGHNYDICYRIFLHFSSTTFARLKFLARFFFVHDRAPKIFGSRTKSCTIVR